MKIDKETKKALVFCVVVGSICVAANLLSGCGTGPKGPTGDQGGQGAPGEVGPQGPAASPSPTSSESAEQQIVDETNEARELQGQAPFTPGLSCTVQLVGSGQWLSSTSPGYVAAQGVVTATAGSTAYPYLLKSDFNQPDSSGGVNSLIPTALQALFVGNNYKITCNGQLVVVDPNYYNFDMNSDDGSILTIDGTQVINDDGNHAMTDKTGTKFLTQGVHTFQVLYAQSGAGNFGLVLQSNGSLLDSSGFYH